jgi:NitT/TauT family transport system substrate-binding protein
MRKPLLAGISGMLLVLAACGSPTPAAPAASSQAPASAAAKPSTASTAGSASAKPAASAAASASAAGSAAAKPSAAGATAKPSASGSAQLKTVSFGLVGKNATEWPLYVGDAEGLFRDQGIKIDQIVTSASASTAQQLAAKAIDMGTSGIIDFIRAINSGAAITIANSSVSQPLYTMLAQPTIKTWADLKGKTVSIGGPKDITLIYLDAMAKANGLTTTDFQLTYAGSTNDRYTALKSGAVAGTFLFPPFDFVALGEGYTNLGSVQTVLPDLPFTAHATNVAWAQQNKDAIVGFEKGFLSAVKWLYTPANKDAAIKDLIQATNATPDAAAKTYDLFFTQSKNVYHMDGGFTEAGFNTLLKSLVTLGDLKEPVPPMSKFFDDSYVKAAAAALK